MRSSPAVADVNGDGLPDIVVLQGGDNPQVIAWTAETDTVIWRVALGDGGLGNHGRQAVIADLDGNGSLEVLVGNKATVRVLSGISGEELTSLKLGAGNVTSAAAVGDLDGDGTLEVVAMGRTVDVWNSFEGLGSSVGTGIPYATPYPMWRGDAARQGAVIP